MSPYGFVLRRRNDDSVAGSFESHLNYVNAFGPLEDPLESLSYRFLWRDLQNTSSESIVAIFISSATTR